MASLLKVNKTDDIVITQADPAYKIRKRLLKFQHLQKGDVRFVLSSNYDEKHATTLFSILEKGTDRLLISIHIDSSIDSQISYYRTIEAFLKQRHVWSWFSGPQALERYNQIKKELSGSLVKIDAANKIAYILGEYYECACLLQISPNCNRIADAKRNGKVNLIHNFYENRNEMQYGVYDCRPVEFINASNVLQTAKDDNNCALYTFNTMQAIVKMLQDKDNSEVIYKEALRIGHGTNEEYLQARIELAKIFQENLKPYLSCYYNSDGAPKSESELKEFHLKQRWELGSRAALDEKYLASKHFLPN